MKRTSTVGGWEDSCVEGRGSEVVGSRIVESGVAAVEEVGRLGDVESGVLVLDVVGSMVSGPGFVRVDDGDSVPVKPLVPILICILDLQGLSSL